MAETLPLLREKMDRENSPVTLPLSSKTEPLEAENRSFISAIDSPKGPRPQAIAHRGYRAAFPENTMAAFKGAVKVGAHAIETDIHLTKDSVVVLSHDPTLERCFGKKEKIIDLEWREIVPLRTTQQPGEPMPRLRDLLEYLSEPGLEDIWVLLDIKIDNNAEDVMRLIAATLEEVKSTRPWSERVLLGFWIPNYLPLCAKYLPDYRTAHIGFSITYARQFLKEPRVDFNMLQKSMVGPFGNKFLRDIKAAGRSVFLWTVNDEEKMKWCIMKGVDGVITDDPLKFLDISKNYNGERCRLPVTQYGTAIWINIMSTIFGFMYRLKAMSSKGKGDQSR